MVYDFVRRLNVRRVYAFTLINVLVLSVMAPLLLVTRAHAIGNTPTLLKDDILVISQAVELDNTMYFLALDGESVVGLWRSDGSVTGTELVKEMPGITSNTNLINTNGTLYVMGSTSGIVGDVWKSNGTEAGTALVISGVHFFDTYPIGVDGKLYFARYNTTTETPELWVSHGTLPGTEKLHDMGYNRSQRLAVLDGEVYFPADNGTDGNELWKTDGTTTGTSQVADLYSGSDSSNPAYMVAVQDELYFWTYGSDGSCNLAKTDGTAAGTEIVKEGIEPYSTETTTAMDGQLYFVGFTSNVEGNNQGGVWKSNGTEAGTSLVVTSTNDTSFENYPTTMGEIHNLTVLEDQLLVFADNDTTGEGYTAQKVWTSDGTTVGTTEVASIASAMSEHIAMTTVIDDQVYFAAHDGTHGNELWRTDGTNAGTVLVADITTGTDGAYPYLLGNTAGALYLVTSDATHPQMLRMLDLTPPEIAGTPSVAANGAGWHQAAATINWAATDPSPSSGTPTTPSVTNASTEGVNTYTSGQSCDPAGNCATGSLVVKLDTTPPTGAFTDLPIVVRILGQTITGTASDATSGVALATLTVGATTLTSMPGGGITLTCEGLSCTWSAQSSLLPVGLNTYTLTATDTAGNSTTTNGQYTVL